MKRLKAQGTGQKKSKKAYPFLMPCALRLAPETSSAAKAIKIGTGPQDQVLIAQLKEVQNVTFTLY